MPDPPTISDSTAMESQGGWLAVIVKQVVPVHLRCGQRHSHRPGVRMECRSFPASLLGVSVLIWDEGAAPWESRRRGPLEGRGILARAAAVAHALGW